MVWPDNTVDIARQSYEQTIVCELFDSALDNLANFDIINVEILLFNDRGLQREL